MIEYIYPLSPFCQCGCGQRTKISKVTNRARGYVAGQPIPYINSGHAAYRYAGPEYIVDPDTGCWVWQKSIRMGYGRRWDGEHLHSAHVWYWEQKNGPKPPSMDLDHLCHGADKTCLGGTACRHRRCVNPDHLQPVPRTANVRRGRQTKLTQAAVDEIRSATPYWGYVRDLAAKYGVSRIAVSKIRSGAYWPD